MPQESLRPARRRGVNLTIRADIMETAKSLGLNASKAAEAGIVEAIRIARESAWREANKAAIAAHNERLDRDGPPLKPRWAHEGP